MIIIVIVMIILVYIFYKYMYLKGKVAVRPYPGYGRVWWDVRLYPEHSYSRKNYSLLYLGYIIKRFMITVFGTALEIIKAFGVSSSGLFMSVCIPDLNLQCAD